MSDSNSEYQIIPNRGQGDCLIFSIWGESLSDDEIKDHRCQLGKFIEENGKNDPFILNFEDFLNEIETSGKYLGPVALKYCHLFVEQNICIYKKLNHDDNKHNFNLCFEKVDSLCFENPSFSQTINILFDGVTTPNGELLGHFERIHFVQNEKHAAQAQVEADDKQFAQQLVQYYIAQDAQIEADAHCAWQWKQYDIAQNAQIERDAESARKLQQYYIDDNARIERDAHFAHQLAIQ